MITFRAVGKDFADEQSARTYALGYLHGAGAKECKVFLCHPGCRPVEIATVHA